MKSFAEKFVEEILLCSRCVSTSGGEKNNNIRIYMYIFSVSYELGERKGKLI